MPTYDYICTSCQHAWELEQRIVEDPVRKCPKCRKNTAKRQISSGAGFILKGGGWYADGYGSKKTSSTESPSEAKSTSDATKSESSPAAGGASAASTSGDKKPDTAGASKTTDAKTEKKSPKRDSKSAA